MKKVRVTVSLIGDFILIAVGCPRLRYIRLLRNASNAIGRRPK